MSNANHFVIENQSNKPLDLYVEPEGFVRDEAERKSPSGPIHELPGQRRRVHVRDGQPGSLHLAGDAEVRVEKDGVDVVDLIQGKGVGV